MHWTDFAGYLGRILDIDPVPLNHIISIINIRILALSSGGMFLAHLHTWPDKIRPNPVSGHIPDLERTDYTAEYQAGYPVLP